MACGILGYELIVRVGPEKYETAMEKVNTRAFDFTGKPMKGWVMVASGDHESDDRMLNWVKQGTDFAASLPSK